MKTVLGVLLLLSTALHAEPAIETVYAGPQRDVFGSNCFGMRFKNKTGRPIAANAYKSTFYFLDASGQPFYEISRPVPEMKPNYVASVEICDGGGNLVDWDKKSFRVSFTARPPTSALKITGEWVQKSVKQGVTFEEFLAHEGLPASACRQVIEYNVANFDRIKDLPGNRGLTAENLAKWDCDSVFSKPRTLLVPR